MNEIKVYPNEAAIKADEANLIEPFIAISTNSGKIYYNKLPKITNTVTYHNNTNTIYLIYNSIPTKFTFADVDFKNIYYTDDDKVLEYFDKTTDEISSISFY